MTSKLFRLAVLGIAVSAVLATPTLAADESIDPVGKPKEFMVGKTTGFAVWEEKGTWHILSATNKTATNKERIVFQGIVTVKGDKLLKGNFNGLETKSKKNPEFVIVSKDEMAFEFQFSTRASDSDGLSFTVGPNTESIHFHIYIAGEEVPKGIVIGANSTRPKKASFTLTVPPKKDK